MKTLDYFVPFVYFFKTKDWLKKFIIASLLTYTLIGATPILGWTIEIVRRVGHGEEPVVPELSDWKTFWRLGGRFAFLNILWLLPVLLADILLYLPLIFARSIKPGSLLAVFGGTLGCVLVFLLVYSVIYIFLLPSMLILLAGTGSAWEALNPVKLWKVVRPHFIEHLIVFFIVGVGLLNLVFLLSPFTLFLLLPPMLVYTGLVSAHYAGQLAGLALSDI
ncbi:MAG: DUF4013 domain-containing protein [Anaerolineales bacterium]